MSFNDAYLGTPPWDIGRPQGAFRALADAGELRGRLLDSGCGTGEHALMAASIGLEATGIDDSPLAIEKAQTKARESGLDVRFVVGSVLELAALDSGGTPCSTAACSTCSTTTIVWRTSGSLAAAIGG